MSEADVAQGQSAMPHIYVVEAISKTRLIRANTGPKIIMEIPKFLDSCNFMPWHPALT